MQSVFSASIELVNANDNTISLKWMLATLLPKYRKPWKPRSGLVILASYYIKKAKTRNDASVKIYISKYLESAAESIALASCTVC
jgi:hypothetical protein